MCSYHQVIKAHTIYIQQQLILHPSKLAQQLQQILDTHWACRFNAVHVVCSIFNAIISSLQSIKDCSDKVKAVEASGIHTQIHSFTCLTTLSLIIVNLIMHKSLSDQPQSAHINMAKAAKLVNATT